MKVAFCIPYMIIGGVESVFIRTLDEMLNSIAADAKYKDIEICVITHAKLKEPLYVKWFQRHSNIKICVCYPLQHCFEGIIKYTNFFPLRQIRKILFSVYKKIRQIRIKHLFSDVDVFVDYKNCSFFKELRFFKKRKITWVHGSVQYLIDMNINKHMQEYDKIVGLTDEFIADFKKAFPKLSDKVIRLYNPINKENIIEMAKVGPRIIGKYFCHVSRLEKVQKDLDTLIFAFDDFYLQNNKPDVKLVIIGTGPQEKRLKKLAASLSCGKNIIFTGALDNPFGYMEGAMANILSSKLEGLPTVLLESMTLGTLCVSSDCQYGPREILMDGKAGILFNVGDVKQLSCIMADIYYGNINTSGIKDVATKSLVRFSPKVINEKVMDLLWR